MLVFAPKTPDATEVSVAVTVPSLSRLTSLLTICHSLILLSFNLPSALITIHKQYFNNKKANILFYVCSLGYTAHVGCHVTVLCVALHVLQGASEDGAFHEPSSVLVLKLVRVDWTCVTVTATELIYR